MNLHGYKNHAKRCADSISIMESEIRKLKDKIDVTQGSGSKEKKTEMGNEIDRLEERIEHFEEGKKDLLRNIRRLRIEKENKKPKLGG